MSWLKELRLDINEELACSGESVTHTQLSMGTHCLPMNKNPEDSYRRWEKTGIIPRKHMPCVADLFNRTVAELQKMQDEYLEEKSREENEKKENQYNVLVRTLREALGAVEDIGMDVYGAAKSIYPYVAGNEENENLLDRVTAIIARDFRRELPGRWRYPAFFQSVLEGVTEKSHLGVNGPVLRLIEASALFCISLDGSLEMLGGESIGLEPQFSDQELEDIEGKKFYQAELGFSLRILSGVLSGMPIIEVGIEGLDENENIKTSGPTVSLPAIHSADAGDGFRIFSRALGMAVLYPEGFPVGSGLTNEQRLVREEEFTRKLDNFIKYKLEGELATTSDPKIQPIAFEYQLASDSLIRKIKERFRSIPVFTFRDPKKGKAYLQPGFSVSALSGFVVKQLRAVRKRVQEIDRGNLDREVEAPSWEEVLEMIALLVPELRRDVRSGQLDVSEKKINELAEAIESPELTASANSTPDQEAVKSIYEKLKALASRAPEGFANAVDSAEKAMNIVNFLSRFLA